MCANISAIRCCSNVVVIRLVSNNIIQYTRRIIWVHFSTKYFKTRYAFSSINNPKQHFYPAPTVFRTINDRIRQLNYYPLCLFVLFFFFSHEQHEFTIKFIPINTTFTCFPYKLLVLLFVNLLRVRHAINRF